MCCLKSIQFTSVLSVFQEIWKAARYNWLFSSFRGNPCSVPVTSHARIQSYAVFRICSFRDAFSHYVRRASCQDLERFEARNCRRIWVSSRIFYTRWSRRVNCKALDKVIKEKRKGEIWLILISNWSWTNGWGIDGESQKCSYAIYPRQTNLWCLAIVPAHCTWKLHVQRRAQGWLSRIQAPIFISFWSGVALHDIDCKTRQTVH